MKVERKFAVIYDLDGLTDGQIEQYKREVSAHFDLDPDLNFFDVIWMVDPDTGFKRRQLYARRGTTDVLREKRKINITDMVQHDGPGYVSFKATGKNAEGRQEIAIGAHSIEGLRGEKLAAAVSTAETRAGRRLTLKFVGMGILDYTEVSDPVELKSNAQDLSLAPNATPPAFAPTVAPNAAPSVAVAPLADTVAQGLAEADAVGALAQKTWEAEQAKMRAEAQQALRNGLPKVTPEPDNDPMLPSGAHIVRPEKGFPGVDPILATTIAHTRALEVAKNVATENPTDALANREDEAYEQEKAATQAATQAPKKPRKPRAKKNTVDISLPGQVPTPVETAPVVETVPTQANPVAPTQVNPAAPTQTFDAVRTTMPAILGVPYNLEPPPPQLAPLDFPGKPTKEQEEGYRSVLREYSNQILPMEGGMKPSANIGGPANKLRSFAEHWTGKTTQLMTTTEWDDLIKFLAELKERNSAKGLVKYINDSIGAK